MKEAFEKILERLEEVENRLLNESGDIECTLGITNMSEYSKQIVQEVAEEYNNSWIPCSERLPEDDKKQYIVQKTNGFIDILGFTKDAYKLDRYDFAEYKGKNKQLFYEYDSEYGYIEWECEAWQPLPEPFKERD